jgi:hypothetical protein
MSNYDEYLKGQIIYAEKNKDVINEVNKSDKDIIFPQHILWAKTVCKQLENDKAKTLTINDEYYFTERLVNKLMLFAYLKGAKDIDETSFKKGWEDCLQDVANKLGLLCNNN